MGRNSTFDRRVSEKKRANLVPASCRNQVIASFLKRKVNPGVSNSSHRAFIQLVEARLIPFFPNNYGFPKSFRRFLDAVQDKFASVDEAVFVAAELGDKV